MLLQYHKPDMVKQAKITCKQCNTFYNFFNAHLHVLCVQPLRQSFSSCKCSLQKQDEEYQNNFKFACMY